MLPIGFCSDFFSFWIAIPPYQSRQNEVLMGIISTVKKMTVCANVTNNGAAGIFPPKVPTPLIITVFSPLQGRGTCTTQIPNRKEENNMNVLDAVVEKEYRITEL